MASNNNGFADALNQLNTLLDAGRDVEIDALKKAATYFANELRKAIKMSDRNIEKHLRDSLKIVVKDDRVSVIFEDNAWYWYLAEHGHKKAGGQGRVKGLHFVRNTMDKKGDKISEIMLSEIINRMEG